MIRTGRADVVVAGGTEAAIHPLPIAGFAAMMALSTRNDEPERASRPYDKGRDGFVLGEGAGVVVLESEEHAAARGARIYAEVAGAGHHLRRPPHRPARPRRAPARPARCACALADAGLTAADIVHLNAHATSTPLGDVAEAKAIRAALGDDADHVAVSATKSMTGHLLGAAGAVESIATILALHHRARAADDQPRGPRRRGRPRRRHRRAAAAAGRRHRCRSTTRSASAATTSPCVFRSAS